MNTKVPGLWNGKKERLGEKNSTITNGYLNLYEDKKKEIIELLEYELGRKKEDLGNIIAAL